MAQLKVMTILGTRPEIIRLSRVMAALDHHLTHVIVHTGQNYDYELNELFFEDLDLRKPDHFLNVNTTSLGRVLGEILWKSEKVMREEAPDVVLVLGDTNSAIAAVMAKRLRIPVYHMEAGNRCFDANVPEETNRRMIDAIADFNLVYTEHARRHLLAEGHEFRRVYLTGSPMREVIDHYLPKVQASGVLSVLGLEKRKYLLVSVHREENVDDEESLMDLMEGVRKTASDLGYPAVVSLHPRTRKRLTGWQDSGGLVTFHKPFAFTDYLRLQMDAHCTISDSGTITEESAMVGFPAVTLRNSIERPEGLDHGSILMAGTGPGEVTEAVRVAVRLFEEGGPPYAPEDYCVRDTSRRVVSLIVSTGLRSNEWHGIREGLLKINAEKTTEGI